MIILMVTCIVIFTAENKTNENKLKSLIKI